eukprot:68099-Amphidinium_carterae.1
MNRVLGLGLPAHVKARIVKSLHSVGLYGAEVGDTVATLTSVDVGLAMSLGWPFLAAGTLGGCVGFGGMPAQQ